MIRGNHWFGDILLAIEKKWKHIVKWNIYSGTCSFWWDNWLGDGALAKYCDNASSLNNVQVSTFLEFAKWKEANVRQHVPILLVPIIPN